MFQHAGIRWRLSAGGRRRVVPWRLGAPPRVVQLVDFPASCPTKSYSTKNKWSVFPLEGNKHMDKVVQVVRGVRQVRGWFLGRSSERRGIQWALPSPRRLSQRPTESLLVRVGRWAKMIVLLMACYVLRGLVQQVVAAAVVFGYMFADKILAGLATWGISKTPKAFEWTIESISVRPSWWSSRPSEVVVSNWTWHNPPGFKKAPYLLFVRRMVLEVELGSALSAVRRKSGAVKVTTIHLDGVSFRAERNVDDALNLWVALDLPDQDVNAVVKQLGSLRSSATATTPDPSRSSTTECPRRTEVIEPLPPDDYERFRSSWSGPEGSPVVVDESRCGCLGASMCVRRRGEAAAARQGESEEVPKKKTERTGSAINGVPYIRQDTLVGDPRRRPRWGVPLLFDVERVVATKIEVEVMDLLMVRRHETWFDQNTALKVDHVGFTRDLLVRPDARRSGGVYLGELVWTLIHVLVRKIVKSKPTRLMKNSTLAVAYAVSDLAHYTVARALELAVNAPPQASRVFLEAQRRPRSDRRGACLRVRLLRGRRLMVHPSDRGAVSCHAVVQLRRAASCDVEPGRVVDEAVSKIKVWTRAPSWGETFRLGPVESLTNFELLVVCVHHERVPGPSSILKGSSDVGGNKIAVGECAIPLLSLLTTATRGRSRASDLVAWFRLAATTDAAIGVIEQQLSQPSAQERPTSTCEDRDAAPHLGTHAGQVDLLLGEIKVGIKLFDAHNCPEVLNLATNHPQPRTMRQRFLAAASTPADLLSPRLSPRRASPWPPTERSRPT